MNEVDEEGRVPGTVPNPLATICRKCGNHIQTIPQRCVWDGKECKA